MYKALFLTAAALFTAGIAQAQDSGDPVQYQEEWGNRIKQAEMIGPLGNDLFGDSINYYNGQLSFSVTDIDLKGNSSLPVQLTRTQTATDTDGIVPPIQILGWDINIPYMSGIFAYNYGWQVGTGTTNRCSASSQLPPAAANSPGSRLFAGNAFWRGNSINIPGYGSKLVLSPSSVPAPTDGGGRRFVTVDHVQLRCLPSLANAGVVANGFTYAGEGFLAIAPDGTRYTFNWMASRQISSLQRPAPPPPGSTGTANYTESLQRVEVRLYATRVEDRFGNWVRYDYEGSTIKRIVANDGRQITFGHDAAGQIISATAHDSAADPSTGRVWRYAGSRVTLPDNTYWEYAYPTSVGFRLQYNTLPAYSGGPCYVPGTWLASTAAPRTMAVTHPSGAVGTFTLEPKRHGRYLVLNDCQDQSAGSVVPNLMFTPLETDNLAVTRKRITGPGLAPAEWTLSYSNPYSSFNDGSNYIGPPRVITKTQPDGSSTRYSFGQTHYVDDGKMLRMDLLAPNGTVLMSAVSTYATHPSNPPYASTVGSTGLFLPDSFQQTHVVPRTQTITTVNGDTFTNRVDAFDVFARETRVHRSNSIGYARNDTMAYHDNLSKWVLGQMASVTNTETGQVMMSKQFSSSTALPIRSYSFGLLQQTYAYHADGTLASMTNGVGSWVSFNNWKRGAPQLIQFPDGVSRSGVIDYYGLVSNVTDERGSTTHYTYDAIGRLSTVTYPAGDTVNWAPKTLSLVRLTASELGQPAGNWRMRLNEANHQRSVYLDSRYNPVLEEDRDQTTGAARYVRRSFDWMGRASFESYPSTSSYPTAGVQTQYDFLGRMTTQQTTDGITLGTISHLSGNRRQMTDADGKSMTVRYQAWDSPAYDVATEIAAAEGQTTTMARDVFGMLQSVTQAGLYQGSNLSYTRSYQYDSYKRLCRRHDPESGATLFGYDDASQLRWEAKGQPDAGCTLTPTASATQFHYDVRGRKVFDDYPGTASDTAFGFDAAGNMISSVNAVAAWTYSYNKRGLLESEIVNIDNRAYGRFPRYNALAHETSLTYPDSYTLAFAPNAFGEPTQMNGTCCNNGTPVGLLVGNIQYHPNGRVASYTLGNGLAYQQGLDNRQRPNLQDTRYGGTVFQRLRYTYSHGGNLNQIIDEVDGVNNAMLGYDNLNRLTTASGLWGSYTYGYDPINNLRSRTGSTPLSYAYELASNRLTSVTGLPVPAAPTAALPPPPPGGPAPIAPAAPVPGTPPPPSTGPNPPAEEPPPPPPPTRPPEPYDPCNGVQCTPPPETFGVQRGTGTTTRGAAQTQSAGATRNFGYDARGRIHVDGNRTYTWNDADQIVTMPGIAHYAYDGNGKRIRTVKTNNTIEYTLYSLSGTLFHVTTTSAGSNTNYVQLNGKTIAEVKNGQPTYLHPDLLGSPRLATDANRTRSRDEHFAPYGAKLNGADGKIGYTGHAYDSESGLTYAQARFYDPVIGRFLSIDPIGFAGNPFTFGRYTYGNNSPYKFTDPTGLTSKDETQIGSRIKGGGGGGTTYYTQIGPIKGASTQEQIAAGIGGPGSSGSMGASGQGGGRQLTG
ncbi:RHS repeat-associated core domain-containing protein [Nevskia sp.]|uniref:RHS repeat-associated core domain-containing protein n=1 Tax=Nevskia sp. TaxID=1929292 RepID=UPI0025E6447E|nr:RHS repeat-associated core domain-containing protein [Nevskia sp.]